MKKSRFTDSQIMEALKRAEAGIKVPDLCRELGISSALFYRWRSIPAHAGKTDKELVKIAHERGPSPLTRGKLS